MIVENSSTESLLDDNINSWLSDFKLKADMYQIIPYSFVFIFVKKFPSAFKICMNSLESIKTIFPSLVVTMPIGLLHFV